MVTKESFALFEEMGVLSPSEVESRYQVKLDNYAKRVNIEGQTSIRLARREYLPAIIKYSSLLAAAAIQKSQLGLKANVEESILAALNGYIEQISSGLEKLEEAVEQAHATTDPLEKAKSYCALVIPAMDGVRTAVDAAELLVGHDYWPVPSYNRMLFYT